MLTGVQQIMLGTKCGSRDKAADTLAAVKAAGYDGIELNSFMIHKTGMLVKLMTRAAGMPVGNGGALDWPELINESGLKVTSLHTDLGSLEREPKKVYADAKELGTDMLVITGMYRFDYGSESEVKSLCERLNRAGRAAADVGLELLYHNHNCELQRTESGKRAYDILIDETDPDVLNFEYDSYWMTDGGADALRFMQRLGSRMKLWHINDRGHRECGPYMTPILKEDSMELGYGNMNLDALSEEAMRCGVRGVILESHRNWADSDPVKSLQLSAEYMKRFKDGQ